MSGAPFQRLTARLTCGLRCDGVVLPHELPDLNDFGQLDETHRLAKAGLVILDDASIEGYTVGARSGTEDSLAQTDLVVDVRFDLMVHPDYVRLVHGQIVGQPHGFDPEVPEDEQFGPLVFDLWLEDGLNMWTVWQGPSVTEMQLEGVTL